MEQTQSMEQKIISRRKDARRIAIEGILPELEKLLENAGVPYRIFGSVASGKISQDSDIDLMIMGRVITSDVRHCVYEITHGCIKKSGIKIDLLFEDEFSPDDVARILSQDV
ncbi:nucleotidyltransferase domain-containing protein [Pseudosulfitobacter pseudonitzschiae]|uniref:nucleotidyltransferase domain-containing protein n=1 Tax=Pseudosulfitobacter pseudonitzschiae TaxID=1402135 RepID=UPI003B8025D4